MYSIGDVPIHAQSAQADHLLRDIRDAHWLTHIEQIQSPIALERGGEDDQAARLWNGHEVTSGLWVGDGDRATALDLAHEGGHDAATAANDVAEPHGAETCLPVIAVASAWTINSPRRLEAPRTLTGAAALSVEMKTNCST